MIIGSLDLDKDTSVEKIGEILYEYCQKIGISEPDIRVWRDEDLAKA